MCLRRYYRNELWTVLLADVVAKKKSPSAANPHLCMNCSPSANSQPNAVSLPDLGPTAVVYTASEVTLCKINEIGHQQITNSSFPGPRIYVSPMWWWRWKASDPRIGILYLSYLVGVCSCSCLKSHIQTRISLDFWISVSVKESGRRYCCRQTVLAVLA